MRVCFLSDLNVTPSNVVVRGRRQWTLSQAFAVEILWSNGNASQLVVPRGFICDFASVPRWPGTYWLFGDTVHKSAVLHDFLYSRGLYDRAVCDRIFLAAMVEEGIPAWRRQAMYWAVRAGGKAWFNTNVVKLPEE